MLAALRRIGLNANANQAPALVVLILANQIGAAFLSDAAAARSLADSCWSPPQRAIRAVFTTSGDLRAAHVRLLRFQFDRTQGGEGRGGGGGWREGSRWLEM